MLWWAVWLSLSKRVSLLVLHDSRLLRVWTSQAWGVMGWGGGQINNRVRGHERTALGSLYWYEMSAIAREEYVTCVCVCVCVCVSVCGGSGVCGGCAEKWFIRGKEERVGT